MANTNSDLRVAGPACRFVIVASQRTGSTLLVRSLDSSPEVFCAGELFHMGQSIYHEEHRYCYPFIGSRRLARFTGRIGSRTRIARLLQRFYDLPRQSVHATGFKLMVSQVRTLPVVVPILSDLGVRHLFLYREDSFAAAMSYYRAKVSRKFHSDQTSSVPAVPEKPIDEARLAELVRVCQKEKQETIEMHRRQGGRLISYEQLREDWENVISAIGSEIGIPQLSVIKALDRLTSEIDRDSQRHEIELRRKLGGEPP